MLDKASYAQQCQRILRQLLIYLEDFIIPTTQSCVDLRNFLKRFTGLLIHWSPWCIISLVWERSLSFKFESRGKSTFSHLKSNTTWKSHRGQRSGSISSFMHLRFILNTNWIIDLSVSLSITKSTRPEANKHMIRIEEEIYVGMQQAACCVQSENWKRGMRHVTSLR